MSAPKKRAAKTKFGHVPVSQVRLRMISPSPENDKLYGPVDPDDPEISKLSVSIRRYGLQQPLVITQDN